MGAAIGVAFALLVAVAAAVALRDDDGGALDSFTGAPGTTRAPSRSSPTTAPAGAFDAVIEDAIAFVESERGRSFKTVPVVTALDDRAFLDRFNTLVDEDFAENRADYDASTVTLQAFGILRPGVSLIETERAFGAAGVLGFYDPETDELVVRAGAPTPYARTVIVHELTHAFDDQWFELHRPQYDESDDEVGFGLSAVAEGNARRVEDAYRATMSSSERRDADEEEQSYGANFPRNTFTIAYLLLQLAPYSYGATLVEHLLDEGGEDAVDEALRQPPETSEKVIDLGKFDSDEPAKPVAPPLADGATVDDGVVGAVAVRAMLEPVVGSGRARQAAEGWGGDRYVSWMDGATPCARMAAVMDSTGDLDELRTAFEQWGRQRRGVSVSVEADTLTLTSCAR